MIFATTAPDQALQLTVNPLRGMPAADRGVKRLEEYSHCPTQFY